MSARAIRSTVTMLVLVAVLVGGVVYGFDQLTQPFPSIRSTEPTEKCTTIEKGADLASSQVVVSVYNATDTSGLAGDVLAKLERRDFVAGSVGNAPDGTSVDRVEIWTQDAQAEAAQLVARQFGKQTTVTEVPEPLGPGPDVIVGPGFKKLPKAPRTVTVTETKTECVPIEK